MHFTSAPKYLRSLLHTALLTLVFVPVAHSQDIASFEKRITVKVLPNGLTLLLCHRPEAPVFSYYTLADVGSADDPGGRSGLAHMFEHIAFKGTEDIGTTDYSQEKVALAKVEVAYDAWNQERNRTTGQDAAQLKQRKAAFDAAVADAQKFVIPNQFTQIAEQNGAEGLNASTGMDSTQYFWSMPENRFELWAYLESDRILNPVPREFYKERDVVMEERRMRIDSQPISRMIEQFISTAYVAHPYRRPGVGWPSEIDQVSATETMAFHKKYYVPSNLVVAVVGDVDDAQALPILTKYFGRIPAGDKPSPVTTEEPRQYAEKTVTIREATQPFYVEGYHRGNYRDPDDHVYDAISDILSNGRVSRLYRSLVRDQQIAAEAQAMGDIGGHAKYQELYTVYAVPLPGHTSEEMRKALHLELDKLKTTDVTDDELNAFKTRARAELLRQLGSNASLAELLAIYQTRFGDWRQLFRDLDEIDKVTKADIRRVAQATFTASNRTSAQIDFAAPQQTSAPQAAPPQQPQTEGKSSKGGLE